VNARPPITIEPVSLPPQTAWLLLGGFLGAVLLNAHHTALWCLPLALGAVAWRARSLGAPPRLPARYLRIGVAGLLTLAVLVGFHTLNGIEAGSSLLVAMATLKLTETVRRRDWLIVLGASLFLLLAACLDGQALWLLPIYAAELWVLCGALYGLGAGADAPPAAALLRRSALSLGLALPLAVLLFLFVPRLSGSFWAIPQPDQAYTGLGDEMSPGSISQLTQSGDAALRVRFDGPLPPTAQRYWRGPVLHDFDGYTWRRRHPDLGRAPALQFQGPAYSYEITLEPTHHNVLIALELPEGVPDTLPNAHPTFDYQLIAPTPLSRAVSYRLQSYIQHRTDEPLSAAARQLDLQLPPGRNPRSLELAHTLRAATAGDRAYVDAVLDYLRHGDFSYTLEPPLLDLDSVDDLLFRTREGFCGHYASAFVMLMRAGGVPARVVTGYLGGIWNRYGEYLYITQSDAHAWAEVWLEGRGWIRIDPTAVVAPGRLTEELDDLLPAAAGGHRLLLDSPWVSDAVQAWQGLNAWWQDEFLGFNFARQLDLLGRLGIRNHDLQALAMLMAAGAAIWLALIAWGLRPRPQPSAEDGLSRSWRALERKLRRLAPARAAYECPTDYAARVGRAHPELSATLAALARRYARLRYGPSAGAAQLEQFRRAVRLLRLRLRQRPWPARYRTASGSRTRASSSAPPMKNTSSTSIDRR
jgi:protein-glutamine gamma-glutamyltransferase